MEAEGAPRLRSPEWVNIELPRAPPMPAPRPHEDVGGYVNESKSDRNLSHCRSRGQAACRGACALALSLQSVCVYPGSTLKFHLAYDPRDHQSDYAASQQLFDPHPQSVRERLGNPTRQYEVLRGGELFVPGVRDCNAPRPS